MFPFPFSFISGVVPDVPVERIANAEAMSFNGVDAYMLAETSALSGVSEFSISVWIKSNNAGVGSSREVLSATQGNTGGIVVLDNSSGEDILAHVGSTTTYNRYNNIISEGVWTHLVMVYDGSESVAGNRIKLYKNGNLQTRSTYSGSIPATSPSVTSSTYIGTWALNPGSAALFDGDMDELAIFNKALSSEKITQIYNATAVVGGVPQTANLFTGGLDSSLVYWNRMGDS
jgi:hypothetical protein